MATTIDEFLSEVPRDKRDALDALRGQIRAAAPEATEVIAYGVPAFKLDGRPLVSFGSAKTHCAFYVQSPAVIEAFADRLWGFKLTKGSVLFSPDRRMPGELVRQLVQARIAEVRAPRTR